MTLSNASIKNETKKLAQVFNFSRFYFHFQKASKERGAECHFRAQANQTKR